MIKYDSSHPDYKPSWDQWSLRVDADGVTVPEKRQSDADRFAQPRMKFKYGGTIHGLPEDIALRHPGFEPASSSDEQCKAHKHQTAKMMFVLAQTPGRRLIEIFSAGGRKLKIHPDMTSAEGADAICDKTAKSLYFHPRVPKDPTGFACAAHELRHDEKNQPIPEHKIENGTVIPKQPGFLYDHTDTLRSAIATADIQEPDARMMSAYVRASFIFDQPGDHPLRWKPPGYETFFDSENPTPHQIALKNAVMKAGHYLEEGHPEKFMREIFLFERANNDNEYYHKKALQVFLEYATPPTQDCKNYKIKKKLFDKRMENFMQVDYATPEAIKMRFPYLEDSDVLQLHQPVLHSDPEARAAYAKLQTQIENLGSGLKHKPNLDVAFDPVVATIEAPSANRMADRFVTNQPQSKPAQVPGWLPAQIGHLPASLPQQHHFG